MFCRKNKKYYFAKEWGCHGTPGTPGVDDPDHVQYLLSVFQPLSQKVSIKHQFAGVKYQYNDI